MKVKVTALYSCGMCIAPENWRTNGIPRPYRLYFILGGNAGYYMGGVRHTLEINKFYLFPSSMPFNTEQDMDDRLNHLYFDFMMSPSVISAEPLCCSADENPLFTPLLDLMKQSVTAYRYGGRSELRDTVISILEAFLALFLEISRPTKALSEDIVRALEYIEQSYSGDISVREVADAVYLEVGYFIKKFKAALGITPYAYIKNLRMAVARELRHGGESLKDASASAGFKYPSSYCRALSKQKNGSRR